MDADYSQIELRVMAAMSGDEHLIDAFKHSEDIHASTASKVFGVPSDFFGEEVGACIKMQEGFAFDEEKIRSELSQKLAKFKIPAYFVEYKDFPLLGSGKIDTVTLKKDILSRLSKG